MLYALDIETTCARSCEGACKHALEPHNNRITKIGMWNPEDYHVFNGVAGFKLWYEAQDKIELVGHNLKFDLINLHFHGFSIPLEDWKHDTQILAHNCPIKIPNNYLEKYEAQRLIENKLLPKGYAHRRAKKHSLKTLAPYFLNVEPFWEDPTNHENDEYVLKDCEYTYKLYLYFIQVFKELGLMEVYENKLIPWTKNLIEAEKRGVRVDMDLLNEEKEKTAKEAVEAKKLLHKYWGLDYEAYYQNQVADLSAKYKEKCQIAIAKLRDKSKAQNTVERYNTMLQKAIKKIEPFNINSSTQLMWLLRNKKYNLSPPGGGKPSTGKSVLEKLAKEGKEDIKVLLRYRIANKLLTSFFPSYEEFQQKGIIHCTFNPTGTRTGRLSSQSPNLQQVPGHLHNLFIAREGYKLATYDASAIEPAIIAYLSEDPVLVALNQKDINFHSHNTKVFFDLEEDVEDIKQKYPKERGLAKEIGLALFYGAGPTRIYECSIKHGFNFTKSKCRDIYNKAKKEYEQVFKFKTALDETYRKESYIKNIFGRPCVIESEESIYMTGFNTLVQSSASDLVQESAHRIIQQCNKDNFEAHLLLLVHDELVIEFKGDDTYMIDLIKDRMTNYELTTQYGPVKLGVEGMVAKTWTK